MISWKKSVLQVWAPTIKPDVNSILLKKKLLSASIKSKIELTHTAVYDKIAVSTIES